MIRKTKLAIVVAGVLLLAGVAFGAPRPSKPIILWTQDGFVCTNKVWETNSLETRKYNANIEERARLRERKYILQQDINVSESTCDTLPRKQKAPCRRGVNELKSIEQRLDQINLFASRYYSCINNDIAWSHPVTRLSFSPYRSHDIKTIVPGEFSILWDWSISTNKGTATISYLGFQMVDNTHGTACDIFGEYELRDGMDKVISIGKVSDGIVRFDLTPTFIASTKSNTLRLIWKGAPTRGEGHFDPKICVMEMRPTDYARSRIETEGDNSGFGPYGYLYEVQSPAADVTLKARMNDFTDTQLSYISVWNNGIVNGSRAWFYIEPETYYGDLAKITVKELIVSVEWDNTVSSIRLASWAVSPVVNGEAHFYGLNLPIWAVTLEVSYSGIGTGNIVSWTKSQVTLETVVYEINWVRKTLNANVKASPMTLVNSAPIFTYLPLTHSLITGNIQVFEMNISASTSWDVIIHSLPIFTIPNELAQVNTTSPWTLNIDYVVRDGNGQVLSTTSGPAWSDTDNCRSSEMYKIQFTNGLLIAAGTTQKIKIYATVKSISTGGTVSTGIASAGCWLGWQDVGGWKDFTDLTSPYLYSTGIPKTILSQ